jgi:hypothetical protein
MHENILSNGDQLPINLSYTHMFPLNAPGASGDLSGIRLLLTIYSILCHKYMDRLPRDYGGMGLSPVPMLANLVGLNAALLVYIQIGGLFW